MGLTFPSAAVRMAKHVAVTPLTALLRHLGHILLAALARSGLLRPARGGEEAGEPLLEESSSYVLVMDGATPSLVHVSVLTALVKDRVPVVEYAGFLERNGRDCAAPAAGCAVCLSEVEMRDEVRELCNCRHVFHRQCLDCWVDLGHVTCPLCRSSLLPPSSNIGLMRPAAAAGDSSTTQRPTERASNRVVEVVRHS